MTQDLGCASRLHSQLSQLLPQLFQRLHLNRPHAQLRRALQIQRAVVDEAALLRIDLRSLNRQTINAALRLAQSDEAGADKQAENSPQTVLLDAVQVQLAGLVVDRAHEVFAGIGQRARQAENLRHRLRQREHVIPELLAGEGTVAVEHGALQIFVERDATALKLRDNHLVPRVKLFIVETKVFERSHAFGAVPGVAQQHSSYVPKDGMNGRHV